MALPSRSALQQQAVNNNAGTTVTQTQAPTITTGVQSGSSSDNSTSRSSSVVTSSTQNMSKSALGALDTLIRGLMSGSKEGALAGIENSRSSWNSAVSNAEQLQSDYSKSAAFQDAQGAMAAQLAEGIKQAMPTITAGIDASGTSGSAMAALLTQQAAEQQAAQAARLGLDAAINYGNIAVAAGQQLAGLATSGDPALSALLDALGISKGAVQNTKETSDNTTSSSSSSRSQSNSMSVQSGGATTTTTTPIQTGNSKKSGSFQAPASSAVTVNTGSGLKTTYDRL